MARKAKTQKTGFFPQVVIYHQITTHNYPNTQIMH